RVWPCLTGVVMAHPLLTHMLIRSSIPKLAAPGPSAADLDVILQAGFLAPDHQYLRPTRVHVINGDDRSALGEVFVRAALSEEPELTPDSLERLRLKPLRAPLILAVGCHTVAHPKVPEIEQVASTSAAVALMQTAADALGYASMWRTGPMAYHPLVKRTFDLSAGDHLIAFLYLGTANTSSKRRPTKDFRQWVQRFPKPL
ncbi:MAG: nitroreductase, partial [Natronospirillum sp.]